jgi:hypothetical protein
VSEEEAPSPRLIGEQAAAYREMAPYIGRLQDLSRRLGWPLGQLLIRSAVEQLERDHRSAGRTLEQSPPHAQGAEVTGDTWNALTVREEIRGFLKGALADRGSSMDRGGGMGVADLWVLIGGREYLISVKDTGRTRETTPEKR